MVFLELWKFLRYQSEGWMRFALDFRYTAFARRFAGSTSIYNYIFLVLIWRNRVQLRPGDCRSAVGRVTTNYVDNLVKGNL